MHTEIVKITEENKEDVLERAGNIIATGGLVVFPTETVYGLGANVFDEQALAKIFTAKGRPSDNPLIVHVGSKEQLVQLTEDIKPLEQKLIDKFWPGPLTIIFTKKAGVSDIVSGGLPTIAVRMPSFSVAQTLIEKSGVPIAAPSANTSGRPSSTTGATAYEDLVGKVDMILEAGDSPIGVESTVVRVGEDVVSILRPGAVTKEMLEAVVAPLPVISTLDKKDLQSSPGTKYKHYAPTALLEIVPREEIESYANKLRAEGKKVGIALQNEKSLEEVSQNLYSALRYFDTHKVDIILVPRFAEEGLGLAIMDRLTRASGK
jgi:L-threonylcarbamoyladenylate synthase